MLAFFFIVCWPRVWTWSSRQRDEQKGDFFIPLIFIIGCICNTGRYIKFASNVIYMYTYFNSWESRTEQDIRVVVFSLIRNPNINFSPKQYNNPCTTMNLLGLCSLIISKLSRKLLIWQHDDPLFHHFLWQWIASNLTWWVIRHEGLTSHMC